MLIKPNALLSIHAHSILTMKTFLNYIHKNKSLLVKILLFSLAFVAIYIGVRKITTHSIVIGHPSEIIVISADNGQDVIVIGDPEKVNVKPKRK